MAVDDEARTHLVGGEQLPDRIGMARQQLRASVAQMRGQRGAGGDGVGNLPRRRRRVADGDADPVADEMIDQRQRPADLRRERDESDASAGRLLTALEIVDARIDHMRARVRAPRPVLGRHVRSLHVDARDRRVLDAGHHPRAGRKVVERRGDERRQAPRHSRPAQTVESQQYLVFREIRSVEIDAGEAVHLEIEQPRQLDSHAASLSRISPFVSGRRRAADSRSR